MMNFQGRGLWATVLLAAVSTLTSCGGAGGGETKNLQAQSAESCMQCHNASLKNDYTGPGIENPHPFPGADKLLCTQCHGGDGTGGDQLASHVPPPPEIGNDANLASNQTAYFNRLTLTGIDKYPNYTVAGTTYSALDYLQFINPGDLRVVTVGRSCGQCHSGHADTVSKSLLATEAGILSGATFAFGIDNLVPASDGLYEDTAADLGFRAVMDLNYVALNATLGAVGELLEFPVFSVRNAVGASDIHNNPAYLTPNIVGMQEADGQVLSGSPLANLLAEQVAFTCGDCHLGSAGANNRAGDFRSSGCTACHMPYSLGGRSGSLDPNVNKLEPADPDDIDAPERAHVGAHKIVSVKRTLSNGASVEGINDYACAGCHQGSNRTVMQFWGIRLDQNQDVRNNRQYPANPASYQSTSGDTRLFDPVVGNNTFNGRNRNQYLRFEDYDNDGRDDTPADVHYEAGMGCIDCHGSFDLHGGDTAQAPEIMSRMEHGVAIACENCHGGADAYATTAMGTRYDGSAAQLGVDSQGNALKHIVKEGTDYFLYSRLTGAKHYIPQTLDTIVDSGAINPDTTQPVYTAQASYAMGRADGNVATGIGPNQTQAITPSFSHTDRMDCATCHSAWTNTCMGCHLEGEYNTGNNFSNITGERIVFREKEADFVYQSPVPFTLGVGADNTIKQFSSNTKAFFKWEDQNNVDTQVYGFSDRKGKGNNPATAYPSMSHNAMMAHSIRGRVSPSNEGPRYCVACHLTDDAITNFGTDYTNFKTALATNDFGALDFNLLKQHIGQNPGNQLNSPIWVHMVAGLGSGLFLFDADGAPVNPLDTFAGRKGAGGVAPSTIFDPARVTFDLDGVVEANGLANGSNNHPLLNPGFGPTLRDGAADPNMSGPLGATLIELLTDPTQGVVLDSWIDADGQLGGAAGTNMVP